LDDDIFGEAIPIIYVLSDSRGETANAVVMARRQLSRQWLGGDRPRLKRREA